MLFDSVLANFKPGHQDAWVDFKNPARAPLLFLSGSEDHIMPASVQASNARHYKAPGTITEHETYEGTSTPDGRRSRLGGDRRPRPRLGAGQRKVEADRRRRP